MDSVNVFNDSPVEGPIEELMPVEQAPIEINLREARRRGRDFFSLLWLFGWGVATAAALSALAVTSQTETASQRLRSIFASTEPAAVAQMPPRVAQLEAETQLLAGQIRALNADRDRLVGRVALLESSIDEMTGTIKRQAAATAAALAAVKTEATARSAATIAEAKADPIATASVPLPPERTTPPQAGGEPEAAMASASEFALDLGSASTLEGVRQRWTTVKTNFGPLLSGMRPLAATDRRQGKTSYRLVVGPLPNAPAAAGLCAHFNAAHTPCRPARFDGEQIMQR